MDKSNITHNLLIKNKILSQIKHNLSEFKFTNETFVELQNSLKNERFIN